MLACATPAPTRPPSGLRPELSSPADLCRDPSLGPGDFCMAVERMEGLLGSGDGEILYYEISESGTSHPAVLYLGYAQTGGERIVIRAAEALKSCLREFDVLARSDEAEFQILLPDPGPAPEERITALARSVAEEIGRHTSSDGARLGLAFGYAIHPADGTDRETLLARTRAARIRMV